MTQVSASPSALPRSFGMTYLLIALNVVTYIALAVKGGPTYENLLAFGAKENGLIALGEVERLFFPMFLHAGLLHLAFNMYGLYQVGRYLEILTGPRRLLAVYVIAGITGNLCSFTFSQALSVGASGSLFGILLCLYVIEKYEQRITRDDSARTTTLGPLIVLNAILSFVIPNIDWANHLGGAIAGALVGTSFVMRHRQNLRRLQAAKFLGIETRLAKTPFFEKENLYYAILVLVNLGFAASAIRVGMAERAFGLGLKLAVDSKVSKRGNELLKQFNSVIESPHSETNPDRLFWAALEFHQNNKFASAVKIYETLLIFVSQEIGSSEFLSDERVSYVEEALQAALESRPPPSIEFESERPKSKPVSEQTCEAPAKLFLVLGFYQLAGKLYECAYYIVPGSIDLASRTIEAYWLGNERRDVIRFVNTVHALQSGELSLEDLVKVLTPTLPNPPKAPRSEFENEIQSETDPSAI